MRSQVNRRITLCFDFNTPGGKALREGISVEELEKRYAPPVPQAQLDANVRMASLPKTVLRTPVHRSPLSPKKFSRPAPYTWSNDKRTLTVYKPLIQPQPNDWLRKRNAIRKTYEDSTGFTLEGSPVSSPVIDLTTSRPINSIDIYGDDSNADGGEIVEWDSPQKQPLDEEDDTVPKRWF